MSAKPATKTAKKAPKAAKAKKPWFPGKMGRSETQPLLLAALAAYKYQEKMGNTDGESFDDWRRAQVLAKVGRNGLSACVHDNYKPLLGLFKLLSGDDVEAFDAEMATGKQSDSAPDGATKEAARQLAHVILAKLGDHMHLADVAMGDLAEEIEDHDAYFAAKSRKEAIATGGGALREGYLVSIVRDKTSRPDLQLGRDLKAGLADRCTVEELRQVLSTLVNRIAQREGTGDACKRNKKAREPKERAARSAKTLAPRVRPL